MDYNNMTVNELRDECRRRGIAAYSKAKKADLVYALENGLDRVSGSSSSRSGSGGSSRDRSSYANYGMVGNSRDRSNYNRVGQAQGGSLQSMTVSQLRNLARQLGVSGYATERKEEIIPKIQRAQGMVGNSRDRSNYNRVGQAQGIYGKGSLRDMTVDKLRDMAREMQIPGYSRNTKQELIEKIQRAKGSVGNSRDTYNYNRVGYRSMDRY